MKCLVMFYSLYGHIFQMANEVVAGIKDVKGVEAVFRKVPETLPDSIIEKLGGLEARKGWADIPDVSAADLQECNGIIIGTPTRFGGMTGQVRQFLDSTGGLWAQGKLIGKVGAAFTSTGTQHGGQEATLLSMHTFFLHHGMLVAGLPYSYAPLMDVSEVIGGSPYGAGTIAGPDGGRMPSAKDLDGARFMGKHVATIVAKLFA